MYDLQPEQKIKGKDCQKGYEGRSQYDSFINNLGGIKCKTQERYKTYTGIKQFFADQKDKHRAQGT